MNGECGQCAQAALEIQRRRPVEQWSQAVMEISDPHVRECVRTYLKQIRIRQRVAQAARDQLERMTSYLR